MTEMTPSSRTFVAGHGGLVGGIMANATRPAEFIYGNTSGVAGVPSAV